MPPAVATPVILTNPGFLWMAPLATAEPTPTVTAGVFSDTIPAAWLPLGATTDGTTFSYSSTVQPIHVAEFLDPITYSTTERAGSIAFNLASWTLTNYQRALNGGIAAIVPTGTTGSELSSFEPPDPGNEVRAMILWQSTDNTVRMLLRKTIQGGQVQSAFQKAPSFAAIPCTYNLEIPTSTTKPFKVWGAGLTRV